jgi:hypothetical protein
MAASRYRKEVRETGRYLGIDGLGYGGDGVSVFMLLGVEILVSRR